MQPCLVLLFCLALLSACDAGSTSQRTASPQSRIFDTQRSALDQAKGVQETLDQATEQQRKQEEQ